MTNNLSDYLIIQKIWVPTTNKVIFSNASINLEAGRITGIFGRTGSGKSTLIRAIMSKLIKKENYSYVEGLEISITFPFLFDTICDSIAFIEQSPKNNLITRSVSDELILSYECAGYEENECEKILSKLENQFGIGHLLDRSTLELSEGEAQKIAICEGIGRKCKLLLLDEPTAHLDEKAKEDFITTLKEFILTNKDCRIIIASHNIKLLNTLCDSIYEIKDQKLIKVNPGSLREPKLINIYKKPKISNKSILEIQNLYYSYGKKEILHNISLKIDEGDRLLIRGPNGSGKSTLLKIIAGLITKGYKGNIKIHNNNLKNLDNIWPYLVYLSMQEPNEQILSTTVQGEIDLNSLFWEENHNLSPLINIFDRWNISFDDFTSTLSYGQKKILSLIPIITKPKLLLLDGPFVGLDTELKQQFIDTLNSLEGITICVTSHEYDEWDQWCTQIYEILV